MSEPLVIIGGDAAGMSAAAKIKRELPEAHVIVFEQGRHISYSACGMPYWIGGTIDSQRSLVILTPEIARKRRGIDVRTEHRVTAIDPANHVVTGTRLDTDESFTQPYSQLLIATGARPLLPPLPGIDLPGVFPLRSLDDGQRIMDHLATHSVSRAAVIGGGYIGVEMAEALRERGLTVTLLELLPQLMPNFDPEMVSPVAAHLHEKGVAVLTGVRVSAIQDQADGLTVSLEGAEPVCCELLIVATGVQPNSELAKRAGIALGARGAIAVDTSMRTNVPGIYAAGDCAYHYHLVTGKPEWIPLATSANKGGRVAGENMAGGNATLPGILGTAVVKVFDYTMASTGLTETAARAESDLAAYVGAAQIENHDKAGYWPGSEPMLVKLVFDRRDGRLYGGQLVGREGVNKRIDILATAITARMTVDDVAVLDLSYAPPYSPTYDPIQICANVAQRQVTG
jgi:CoA-dependent NAD(P)H sulfur oxidoreductase